MSYPRPGQSRGYPSQGSGGYPPPQNMQNVPYNQQSKSMGVPQGSMAYNSGGYGSKSPNLMGSRSIPVNPNQPAFHSPPMSHRPMTAPQRTFQDANHRKKWETDKLIQDCYSKYIIDTKGKSLPEVSYQTHININEFSQFPSQEPPEGLPHNQIGSVKERVLVICVKHSGRVILQKGKYNPSKDAFQIGRTWDMDELRRISKMKNNGIILTLNKDYYWQINESPERIWKFVRFLNQIYGSFIGKYPELAGYTLEELKLPPSPSQKNGFSGSNTASPVVDPIANPKLLKSKSLKRKHLPNPVLPQAPDALPASRELYKDVDFTANGKLPMKPMYQMKVDRFGATSSSIDVNSLKSDDSSPNIHSAASRSSHPYHSISPRISMETSKTGQTDDSEDFHDSQSFVFSPSQHDTESNTQNSNTTEKEPLRSAATTFGRELSDTFNEGIKQPPVIKHSKVSNSPEFGIEEVDDSDNVYSDEERPLNLSRAASSTNRLNKEQGMNVTTSTIDYPAKSAKSAKSESVESIEESNPVSTSIQELEDFMHNQFDSRNRKASKTSMRSISSSINETSVSGTLMEEDESMHINSPTSGIELSTVTTNNEDDLNIEKDPEIEELLDEVGWDPNDDSNTLLKKLNNELNRVKYRNVQQVIDLDFASNNNSSELKTSLQEIENLNHIFKKMEINFQFLAPEVHSIEENSRGLQVKSVNKRILYNDLKAILGNVTMDDSDLEIIQSFVEFDRLNKLEAFELKLNSLYDALGAMRTDTTETENDISSMRALKQYREKYEQVTSSFVFHFKSFIEGKFHTTISLLSNEVNRLSVNNITGELNGTLIYTSLMNFLKDVAFHEFKDINENFNKSMSALLEKILNYKLRNLKHVSMPSATDLEGIGLKKKISRMGTRSKFRLRGSENFDSPATPTDSKPAPSIQVQDSRAVMEIIQFSTDIISVMQYYVGTMFQYDTTIVDFGEFIKAKKFNERRRMLDSTVFKTSKAFSNDIIANMTAIFGGYINLFLKKVTPTDSHIPLLIAFLENILDENKANNQDFLAFNFLKRSIEKFEVNWNKSVKTKIEALNTSLIVTKCGILTSIKDFNQLVLITESSLHNESIDLEKSVIRSKVDKSYEDLTDASIHMFLRDDPLLKNNDFDDKERHHRNVCILQNIFFLTEQFAAFSSEGVVKSRNSLEKVFKDVEDAYFKRLFSKNIGKLVEFVELSSTQSAAQKYNKKSIKTVLSGYTHKDIQTKLSDMHNKLEKHFITGADMFEKDLVDRLWRDMESRVVEYFTNLNKILKSNYDRDIEYNVSAQEVRSMFSQFR